MSRISLLNRARHFNAEHVRIYSGRPLQGTFGGFLLIMVPICENDASVRYEVILREKYPYSVRNRHLDLVQLKAVSRNYSTSVVLEGGEGGIHLHPREIYFLEIEILEKESFEEELAHALSDSMSLIRVDEQHLGQQSLINEDYLIGSIDIKPSPTQDGMFIITLRIRGIELGEAILSDFQDSMKRKVIVGDHRPSTYFRSVPAGIYHIDIDLCGELTIEEYIALIQRANLLISNNTGPVHIAAAVQTPVIVFYALTNPEHLPWNVNYRSFYFNVPNELKTQNTILSYAEHLYMNKQVASPSTEVVVHAAEELLQQGSKVQSQTGIVQI